MLHTTFARAKEAGACPRSYMAIARSLGGVRHYGKDTSIPLTRILELRGLPDALWCLRCVLPSEEAERDQLAQLLALDYAEHVAHFWIPILEVDVHPSMLIEVSRRYMRGEATLDEMFAARGAGRAALSAAKLSNMGRAPSVVWSVWKAAEVATVAACEAAWAAVLVGVAARMAGILGQAEEEWQKNRFLEVLELPQSEVGRVLVAEERQRYAETEPV